MKTKRHLPLSGGDRKAALKAERAEAVRQWCADHGRTLSSCATAASGMSVPCPACGHVGVVYVSGEEARTKAFRCSVCGGGWPAHNPKKRAR